MKIVVEGYDASGKSTLAQALADRLGCSVLEAGPPPKNNMVAVSDSLAQLDAKNVVHSRITPISRLAYQLDSDIHHTEMLWGFVKTFQDAGALFIYCTGRADVHEVKDYDTEEHLEYLEKNESTIRRRYVEIFDKVPHIKYDFRIDDMEKFVCQIATHS